MSKVRNLASARVVGALPAPKSGQVDYFDQALKGFGVRVSAAGRRTWFVMYRDADGKRERFKLGTYPNLSVKDARTEARTALEKVAKGKNPAQEKRERKMADTFAELAEAYLRHYAKGESFAVWEDGKTIVEAYPGFELRGRKLVTSASYPGDIEKTRRAVVAYLKAPHDPPEPRKRSWRKDKSIIERDILPDWRHRKAESITRADVNRLLDKVVSRGAPIQANRTLEIVRKIFSWAIEQSRVRLEGSPCSEVKKRAKEKARDRHLTVDEINAAWPMQGTKSRPAKINEASRIALRLILATAQRPGEVLGMRWAELDGDWQTAEAPAWTIPSERVKNGRTHWVPLSSFVVDLLKQAKALAGDSSFVFPSPRGSGPMLVSSLSHALVRSEHFGIPAFRPHDLRRTAVTHMEGPECGISRFVVARIVNHTDTSVIGQHYSLYQYGNEKREALNAWARRLSDIIEGKKPEGAQVVPLHATKGGE